MAHAQNTTSQNKVAQVVQTPKQNAEALVNLLLEEASNDVNKPLSDTEVQALAIMAQGGKVVIDKTDKKKIKYLSRKVDGTSGSFSHGKRGIGDLLMGKVKRFSIHLEIVGDMTVLSLETDAAKLKAARAVKSAS